jgi:hypothetical protein
MFEYAFSYIDPCTQTRILQQLSVSNLHFADSHVPVKPFEWNDGFNQELRFHFYKTLQLSMAVKYLAA